MSESPSLVRVAKGSGRINSGSLREKMMGHLRRSGGKARLGALKKRMRCNPKPIVSKLLEKGWVRVARH